MHLRLPNFSKSRAGLGALAFVVLLGGCSGATNESGAADTTTEAASTTIPEVNAGEVFGFETHAQSDDTEVGDDVIDVKLIGNGAEANSAAVTVEGSTVTITKPGDYRIHGTLTDGSIVVDSAMDGKVRLVLDGASISSTSSAAIAVNAADEAVVVLADGSSNELTDGGEAEQSEADAALWSAADLTIGGTGTLSVYGNVNDGINSNDGLVILGGTINVESIDDGIRGKDYLDIVDGTLDVQAEGDGLKSDNAEVSDSGQVRGWTRVSGGQVSLAVGDDGVHAETALGISGGKVTVSKSYEGLESAVIEISGGDIQLTSSDDGINVSSGSGSSQEQGPGAGMGDGERSMREPGVEDRGMPSEMPSGMPSEMPQSGEGPRGGGGQFPGEGESASTTMFALISGGTIAINADGDGFDSNGSATMTGGTMVIDGPTNSGNGALDVAGDFQVVGGILVAAGSSGMATTPSTESEQDWVAATFDEPVAAGTTISLVRDQAVIISHKVAKETTSIVIAHSDIESDAEYEVWTGGDGSSLSNAKKVATATAGEALGGGMRGPR